MGRAITFYNETAMKDYDNGDLPVRIITFGGFNYDEFLQIKAKYDPEDKKHIRTFLSTETSGPRVDYAMVRVEQEEKGLAVRTPFLRETLGSLGPKGRDAEVEIAYAADDAVVQQFLKTFPLYNDATGGRLAPKIVRRHGGYPIGICTAWGAQYAADLVRALHSIGIVTKEEIRRANKRFLSEYSLERLLK